MTQRGCRDCAYYWLYRMITDNVTHDTGLLLDFRRTANKELRSGSEICSLYVNGKEVSSCSDSVDDMRAICLAEWFAAAYQDRLVMHQLSVDGSMGMSVVDEIIHECGLQIQLVYSEENHEVYRLTEIPVPKEPPRGQDTKAVRIA